MDIPEGFGIFLAGFFPDPPSLGVSDSPLILSGHPKLIRDFFIELAELLVSAPKEHTHLERRESHGEENPTQNHEAEELSGDFPRKPWQPPGMLQNPPIVLTVNIKI